MTNEQRYKAFLRWEAMIERRDNRLKQQKQEAWLKEIEEVQ